jgi:hypothetical protein
LSLRLKKEFSRVLTKTQWIQFERIPVAFCLSVCRRGVLHTLSDLYLKRRNSKDKQKNNRHSFGIFS